MGKKTQKLSRHHPLSGLTPILVIVILGFAAFIGYFILKSSGSPSKVMLQTTTPTNNPTSDWKTYINEQYSFELKYPENYSITQENNFWLVLTELNNNHQILINFYSPSEEKAISDYDKSFSMFASWFAMQQCASDYPGPNAVQTFCDKANKITVFENPSGFTAYKIYVNLIRQRLNNLGNWETIDEKTGGPFIMLDASTLTNNNLKGIAAYYSRFPFISISIKEIEILENIIKSIRPISS